MTVADSTVCRIRLTNPEDLVEGIRGSELEPCQLTRQSLDSELFRLILPASCLDIISLGPAMLFTGRMPLDSYTLVFVLKCPEKGRSFNFSVEHSDGYIGFFRPGGHLDAFTPAGYENATLTVSTERFLSELIRRGMQLPERLLAEGAAMPIAPAAQRKVRRLVADLKSLGEEGMANFTHLAARTALEEELFGAFFEALEAGSNGFVPPSTSRIAFRQRRLNDVREFLSGNDLREITLSKLCEVADLSDRGLENLFRDHLGVTPHTYLRHLRLHAARRDLLREGDARPESVKEVALQHGFWHLGRFARYYREVFGEFPNGTLAKR